MLVELHAAVTEDRAAALLTAGDALTAFTVLQTAVRDEPYRDRRWELDSRAVTGLAAESWQHVDTV